MKFDRGCVICGTHVLREHGLSWQNEICFLLWNLSIQNRPHHLPFLFVAFELDWGEVVIFWFLLIDLHEIWSWLRHLWYPCPSWAWTLLTKQDLFLALKSFISKLLPPSSSLEGRSMPPLLPRLPLPNKHLSPMASWPPSTAYSHSNDVSPCALFPPMMSPPHSSLVCCLNWTEEKWLFFDLYWLVCMKFDHGHVICGTHVLRGHGILWSSPSSVELIRNLPTKWWSSCHVKSIKLGLSLTMYSMSSKLLRQPLKPRLQITVFGYCPNLQ